MLVHKTVIKQWNTKRREGEEGVVGRKGLAGVKGTGGIGVNTVRKLA